MKDLEGSQAVEMVRYGRKGLRVYAETKITKAKTK